MVPQFASSPPIRACPSGICVTAMVTVWTPSPRPPELTPNAARGRPPSACCATCYVRADGAAREELEGEEAPVTEV